MTIKLAPKRICSADDPEWKHHRDSGIGASESAAACGVSEWSNPLEIYYRKRGELPPIEENRAMRLGRKLEPIIADEFESETGLKIAERSPGLYRHPTLEHVLATPDGIISADELIEIKTMNDRRAQEALGEQYTDEIPHEWLIQAQQQMLVMDAQTVWFAVLVGGADFRLYEVQRHERVIQRITEKVTDLWQRIQTGNPPDMDDSQNNLQMVRELFGKVAAGSVVDLSEQSARDWQRYEALGKIIDRRKTKRDNLKARVLLELAENEAGRLPDGRCVRRKWIEKAEHVVKASRYIDARAVSGKNY